MPHILISYRRADSDAIAGRIRDRVVSHFGEEAVFMDIDSIPFRMDFRKQVQSALMQNDVVLAVIGPKWMGAARGGTQRITEETDPVRVELETALSRGIPVIPVLVGRATMPKAAELPESLRDLPYLNAAEISAGRDFNQHIDRLLRSIESYVKTAEARTGSPGSPPEIAEGTEAQKDAIAAAIAKPKKYGGLRHLMARAGLLFPEPSQERAFLDFYCENFYAIGQTSMMFGIVGWIVFGATDLLSGVAGLASIQFRFMLATPLMVAFFGLSFTTFARRHWQKFFAAFAVVGITCMCVALLLVGPQSWFRLEQATMSFMLFIAFVGLAPFTTIYTIGVGLFIVAAHTFFLTAHGEIDAAHVLFYSLFVGGAYVVACTGAWVRERSLRSSFAAGKS